MGQTNLRVVENSSMDKNKALDAALSQIERAFGKGSIMKLGSNPVVEIEAISTGSLGLDIALGIGGLTAWLWLTVWFANFAEAMAEGRGKAQAAALRRARQDVLANRVQEARFDANAVGVPSSQLTPGMLVKVSAGELIPGDGDIVLGVASVDESAITGESAPVVRESGGDRCAVTGGTRVLSDQLIIRITAAPGSSFLDRMIAMVEGARRGKTPNEIALDILLAGLTLAPLAVASQSASRRARRPRVAVVDRQHHPAPDGLPEARQRLVARHPHLDPHTPPAERVAVRGAHRWQPRMPCSRWPPPAP